MVAFASPPLPPGSTIGILGGGQLGRMLALAAARLGLRCHVYCPDDDRPAALVSAACSVAPYDDRTSLEAFARDVHVVTYEFENVPAATAAFLAERVPVRPSPRALAVSQDRLLEKTFLRDLGVTTAAFAAVDEASGLAGAIAGVGLPAVLKSRRFGYDGKGQAFIRRTAEAEAAWSAVGGVPALLEAFVPFVCEVSVIVCRGLDGTVVSYDPVRNVHERHVLARSIVPAGLPADVEAEARGLAGRIVDGLDHVGVMGVEMFVETAGGPRLSVNEIAPRVHNSGHWTLDACVVSQFEQHVRAICGWPLGAPRRHSDAVMDNLLGDDVGDWPLQARRPDTAVHIYGKRTVAPGRKMGHVTRLYPLGANPTAVPAALATATPAS
jgi:5-(carboxyamino)imidazole ribonucleotide synthase